MVPGEKKKMEEKTLGGLLSFRAKELGEKEFLKFAEHSFSYKELDTIANRIANGFIGMGIKKNDKVAIMLDNCPEFIFLWFALSKIGAVEVPINTALKGPLLAYILNQSDSRVLVTQAGCLEQVAFIKNELKRIERMFVLEEKTEKMFGMELLAFKELMGSNDALSGIDVGHSDPMAILYTSGTTGPSKGVIAQHNYFYCAGKTVSEHMKYTEREVLYTCLPLFHANAQVDSVMPALYSRCKVAIGSRFSASRFWGEIRDFGATEFNAVGAMLSILEKSEVKDSDYKNSVRLIYAQPRPQNQKAFEKRFGVKLIELYGTTECGSPVTSIPLNADRPGSCGKIMAGCELMAVDEHDSEVPIGQIGEFVVRPTEPFRIFQGYYKMSEETLSSFRNLWFHTGDLGWKDDDGYFYFGGRKKEAIRRRGENISAREVEHVLNSHPDIIDCAVIGVPSELGEEEVKACIVLRPNKRFEPEQLMAFCEARLAYFMIPRYVDFVKDLPRTPTGKIKKYKLKEEGLSKNTWDREKAGYNLKR
jgi:crotonobetaine/carnitine-CoA ligase